MPPNLPQPTPTSTGAADGPLLAEHFRELADARVRAKKVRRAASVAVTSGWTMLFFAVMTFLGGLFGDIASLVMGLGLAALAVNELLGAAMIRAFDLRGPRRLGCNQLALGVLIVAYAAWSLWSNLHSSSLNEMSADLASDPEMQAMVGNISTMVTWGLYGGIAAIGIFAPGLTAWYYFSRAPLIREMVATTPQWVIETMRTTG